MEKSKVTLSALAAVALIGSACNATSDAVVPRGQQAITQPTQVAGTVPAPLESIEGAAEDIIDVVPNADWKKVRSDVDGVFRDWRTYRATAVDDGAPDALLASFEAALDQLRNASGSRQAQETMQASNDLSAATAELYGLYNPAVPIDIGWLDVIGRQVVLDVSANDLTAAGRTVREMQTTWDQVRQSVIDHNGSDIAAQMDATMVSLDKALTDQDGEALTVQAKIELEVVDAMEGLF